MDLVAEMIAAHLPAAMPGARIDLLRAPFRTRLRRQSGAPPGVFDRYVNRFRDYPRWLAAHARDFDVLHVLDHSYAHVARVLPPGRIVVTCHDVDAFAPFTGSRSSSKLPRWLARRVLSGLQRATVIVCVTEATRRDLVRHELVDAHRLAVIPNGVDPLCGAPPEREAELAAAALVGPGEGVDLLHVGSTIPRKRIDVLLAVAARVARVDPAVRVLRVGGPLTADQQQLASSFGLNERIVSLPFVDRRVLAAVYRHASLVLLPSEREGFGLPVVEALAAGTPAVVSDIPALREVGGGAVSYCPVANTAAWADTILDLLTERSGSPEDWARRVEAGRQHASRWSWPAVAVQLADVYRRVAGEAQPAAAHATAS